MNTTLNRMGLAASVLGLAVSGFSRQAKVGDRVPDFSVTNMGGQLLFYKDLHSGPTFIYFVREGDTVCAQETPFINQIASAYTASRASWYGIINAKEDRARAFQAEFNPSFQLERDENLAAIKAFGITSAPAVVQINSRGTVVHVWRGFSAADLKAIDVAYANASHKDLHWIDFSKAPTTRIYGVDYSTATPNRNGGG